MALRMFAFSLALAGCAPATTHGLAAQAHGSGSGTSPPGTDARIHQAIQGITRDSFQRDVESIVFTRSTYDQAVSAVAAREYIVAELRAAGYEPALLPVPSPGSIGYNVVAERPGSDPSRVVMACAHYDAVEYSPGADDNATGVAGILAVARAAARVDTHATVRVVAFALEEAGQLGSRQYVHDLSPAERARIVGVFNLEMIGYSDRRPGAQRYPEGMQQLLPTRRFPDTGDFLGVVGLAVYPEPMNALGRARTYVPGLRTFAVPLASAVVLVLQDLLRSDHASFWAAGIPAVMVTDTSEFRNPNYHTYSDGIRTLDPEFGALGARWISAAVLTMAASGAASGAESVGEAAQRSAAP